MYIVLGFAFVAAWDFCPRVLRVLSLHLVEEGKVKRRRSRRIEDGICDISNRPRNENECDSLQPILK